MVHTGMILHGQSHMTSTTISGKIHDNQRQRKTTLNPSLLFKKISSKGKQLQNCFNKKNEKSPKKNEILQKNKNMTTQGLPEIGKITFQVA